MKFTRKPVVVDAEQFRVAVRERPVGVCFCHEGRGFSHLHTSKGIRRIADGDWIITTAQGYVYTETDQRMKSQYEPQL